MSLSVNTKLLSNVPPILQNKLGIAHMTSLKPILLASRTSLKVSGNFATRSEFWELTIRALPLTKAKKLLEFNAAQNQRSVATGFVDEMWNSRHHGCTLSWRLIISEEYTC